MKRKHIRYMILFIAAVMIITGIICGENMDVLTKAANVCTECIGIG